MPQLFKIIEGQLIGIPEMMGFSRAHVDAIYTDRGVTISIDLPVESGLFPPTQNFDVSVRSLEQRQNTATDSRRSDKGNRELEQETRKLSEAKSFFGYKKNSWDCLIKIRLCCSGRWIQLELPTTLSRLRI